MQIHDNRTSTHVSNSCSQQYHTLVLTLCIHSCGLLSWNIPRNIASHTVDDVYWCWHHTSYIHRSKCLAVDGRSPHPPCNRRRGSPHCNNPCRLPPGRTSMPTKPLKPRASCWIERLMSGWHPPNNPCRLWSKSLNTLPPTHHSCSCA